MRVWRRIERLVPMVAVIGALVGCGGDDPAGTAVLPECTGDVHLQVSEGLTPTITWAPACRLWLVGFEEDDGGDVWSANADAANRIAPGVRYGTTPPGAVSDEVPSPLLVGRTYRVFVVRHTGPGDDDGVLAGSETFVP